MSQGQSSIESLVVVDGCYEVAAILDKKVMKKDGKLKNFYLIFWKGYPDENYHTWEPPENLQAVKDMIKDFEKRRGQKPPNKDDTNKKGVKAKKAQQAMVPEDSEHSKQKGETKDSEAGLQRQRKLRKMEVSSPAKQQTDKNNHISGRTDKKNEIKKKLEGKGNKSVKDGHRQVIKKDIRKRANPFLQLQQSINDPPRHEQPPAKAQSCSQYGIIVNHSYQGGEMYYEVQMLSKQGSVKGTALLVASKIKEDCSSKIAEYLEKYLIELEEWNKLHA